MSAPPPPVSEPVSESEVVIAVDRIACTGHGICAQLLPGLVGLDEWGYPIVHEPRTGAAAAAAAVTLCPARALRAVPSRARAVPGQAVQRTAS